MTSIPLAPVQSSQLHSIGYDPATQTLAIAFRKGAKPDEQPVYHYSGVTHEDWSKFQKADSHGSHFYKHIKGKFPYTKVS